MSVKRFFQFILIVCLAFVFQIAWAQEDADAPYLNPDLPVEERVEDLLSRMTLEEKIGQMTLVENRTMTVDSVTSFMIGGVLSGGGGYPTPNNAESWAEMVDGFQSGALATRLAIPLIYGVDAVHGHNNVYGATIFPHNIGLGATRNAELVAQTAEITAKEMIATGIYWDYAPVMAIPQDIRWGRTYEGFGENTELVDELSNAYMLGLQGNLGDPLSVLATPKHYVGDGSAMWGTSPFGTSNIDRGDARIDEATLRSRDLVPYLDAIENGAMSIMASYSSWNGVQMHGHDYLINDVLKGELGFEGFVVSDWAGIDAVADDYYDAVVASINAGIDMNMVPQQYPTFIEVMLTAVENGDITMERIDDAVTRILRTKFMMGLFENPYSDPSLLESVGSDEHRAVARQAVSESLVLLRNEEQTLPITDDVEVIFMGGQGADDIGLQSGGWTIEWSGSVGPITPGTTIRDGIEALAPENAEIRFSPIGSFGNSTDADGNPLMADLGIAVIAELPYVEQRGDNPLLNVSELDAAMIERMRERSEKLVIIVLSGRPIILTEQLLMADAVVAAWLPGTEGNGIADVLFGNQPFTGRLPYTWPRNIEQLPFDFDNLPQEGCDAPLFPYDYGLTYENAESPWIELAIACAS